MLGLFRSFMFLGFVLFLLILGLVFLVRGFVFLFFGRRNY